MMIPMTSLVNGSSGMLGVQLKQYMVNGSAEKMFIEEKPDHTHTLILVRELNMSTATYLTY